jgi:hypothetical protein
MAVSGTFVVKKKLTPVPDPDSVWTQGFDDQKVTKFTAVKMFNLFLIKNRHYRYRTSNLQKPSALKSTSKHDIY